MKRILSYILAASLLAASLIAPDTFAESVPEASPGITSVSAGEWHTIGMREDGTFAVTGYNASGQCNVQSWTDVVSFSCGKWHSVGLRADGTVLAAGDNSYGQCNVEGWTDIVMVSAGDTHTVALRSDGIVVGVGDNSSGQLDIGWVDIIAVSAGATHTVGLKKDGTAVAAGNNGQGQCDVQGWVNLVSVAAGGWHTVGLMKDGTAVAAGYDKDGQCGVSGWRDITAVSAGGYHTVGLRKDGTVVAVGFSGDGRCDTGGWLDIVGVSAGEYHTVAVNREGRVFACGLNKDGQCDVNSWKPAPGPEDRLWEASLLADIEQDLLSADRITMSVKPDAPAVRSAGIEVDFGPYNIREDSVLDVRVLPPKVEPALGLQAQIYYFSLTDGQGLRSGFNTLVEVTLPCAADENGSAFVQRYDGGRGEWELLPCSRDAQAGMITFRTDHFSFIGVFESTGQQIPGSIFSYVGEYRGPMTPVMITDCDIRRYLLRSDTSDLVRALRIARIPEDDALSQGAWWLAAVMGGVGYAQDNGAKVLEFFMEMDEAKWAKLSPVFTGIGAFFTMARIGYQAYRGVHPGDIVYDNALDLVETWLSIAAVYTGNLPLAFMAAGVFSTGQLYEAYKWASSETVGWEETTYRYFNQHDAQFSLDDLEVVWEEDDREGYVRLDLGGTGCAAALDAIYRKYCEKGPVAMLEAIERFIDDYCGLFWKYAEENINRYYVRKISVQSLYATVMAPLEIKKPAAADIGKYQENFKRMLHSELKPLMQAMVERLYADIERELINETRKVVLPLLNRKMSFEVEDPELDKEQKFDESRFSRHDSVIAFENPKSPPFELWNYHSHWLDRYGPRAEVNSNTVYRCTWFHWLSLGQPQAMGFISNDPGDNEVQTVKIQAEVPLTKVKLESWWESLASSRPISSFVIDQDYPAPVDERFVGSWYYTGNTRDIRVDIKAGDVAQYQVDVTIVFVTSPKPTNTPKPPKVYWDYGIAAEEYPEEIKLFRVSATDDNHNPYNFHEDGTLYMVNGGERLRYRGYSLKRIQ